MSPPAHSKTRRRLAFLFSVPLAFSLVFFFVSQAAEHRETRLLEVQRLSTCFTQLRAHARDAEAGERGFYLTGDDRYLAPLKQAQDSLPTWIRQAQAYSRDRPKYQVQVQKLIALVQQRFREAVEGVNLKRTGQLTPELFTSYLNTGQDTMDAIRKLTRDLLGEVGHEEVALLDAQRAFSNRSFLFFFLGSLLMIGVIVWLYNTLLRYLSERDTANENLKTANIHLEARIEERTRDLSQANEELQQFAYVASHDLQEPLRTITSFSQLLALRYKDRLDADADEFIGYIVSSSRRMTDLINGLLALVRLRKAGEPRALVSLQDLLEQAEISLQAAIRESGARIEHTPLPDLVVDPVQISQVLQNLISNAIKYRGTETPLIEIKAERKASEWQFSIRDNGQGFDPQFAERIFGLFQRLQTRQIDGTGMGLAIARKIIERHSGRMWAESAAGSGSTFYFTLPVSAEGKSQAASVASETLQTG